MHNYVITDPVYLCMLFDRAQADFTRLSYPYQDLYPDSKSCTDGLCELAKIYGFKVLGGIRTASGQTRNHIVYADRSVVDILHAGFSQQSEICLVEISEGQLQYLYNSGLLAADCFATFCSEQNFKVNSIHFNCSRPEWAVAELYYHNTLVLRTANVTEAQTWRTM